MTNSITLQPNQISQLNTATSGGTTNFAQGIALINEFLAANQGVTGTVSGQAGFWYTLIDPSVLTQGRVYTGDVTEYSLKLTGNYNNNIQAISNTVAQTVITQALNTGTLPDVSTLVGADLQEAQQNYGITPGGWGAASYYWNEIPSSATTPGQTLGQSITQTVPAGQAFDMGGNDDTFLASNAGALYDSVGATTPITTVSQAAVALNTALGTPSGAPELPATQLDALFARELAVHAGAALVGSADKIDHYQQVNGNWYDMSAFDTAQTASSWQETANGTLVTDPTMLQNLNAESNYRSQHQTLLAGTNSDLGGTSTVTGALDAGAFVNPDGSYVVRTTNSSGGSSISDDQLYGSNGILYADMSYENGAQGQGEQLLGTSIYDSLGNVVGVEAYLPSVTDANGDVVDEVSVSLTPINQTWVSDALTFTADTHTLEQMTLSNADGSFVFYNAGAGTDWTEQFSPAQGADTVVTHGQVYDPSSNQTIEGTSVYDGSTGVTTVYAEGDPSAPGITFPSGVPSTYAQAQAYWSGQIATTQSTPAVVPVGMTASGSSSVYTFNLGTGPVQIQANPLATIAFGAGITDAMLSISANSATGNIVIAVAGTQDSITILGGMNENGLGASIVSTLAFADGTTRSLVTPSSAGDTIVGGAGNDTFAAGVGSNAFDGGLGKNSMNLTNAPSSQPVTVDLTHGIASGWGGQDMFANIQRVVLGASATTVSGGTMPTTVVGGQGAATLIAGSASMNYIMGNGGTTYAGSNEAQASAYQMTVTGGHNLLALGAGTDSVSVAGGSTTVTTGAGSAMIRIQSTTASAITATPVVQIGTGNVTINATGSAMTQGVSVVGGQGTLYMSNGGHASTVVGGTGAETIFGGNGGGSYTASSSGLHLVAAAGQLTMVGGGRDSYYDGTSEGINTHNSLTFTAGMNTAVLGGGADTVVLSGGQDMITGGSGTASVTLTSTAQDSVHAYTGTQHIIGGSAMMTINAVGYSAPGGLSVQGQSGALYLSNGAAASTVVGGQGAATVFAGQGGGVYTSGLGAIHLVAGLGSQVFSSSAQGSYYDGTQEGSATTNTLNVTGGSLIGVLGAGVDHVSITGGTAQVTLGSAQDQVVVAGHANVSLHGGHASAVIDASQDLGRLLYSASSGSDMILVGAGGITANIGSGQHLFVLPTLAQMGGGDTITGMTLRDHLQLRQANGAAATNAQIQTVLGSAQATQGGTQYTLLDHTQLTVTGVALTQGSFGPT